MSFGTLNIDVALQISNKILFEEPFGDALMLPQCLSKVWENNQVLVLLADFFLFFSFL